MSATLLLSFLIGVVAGSRSMLAPAAVAWGVGMRWIVVDGTWASFMVRPWVRYVITLLAVGELIADKLPATPSRKAIGPFGGRIVSGAFCGAVLGASHDSSHLGAILGALGAIVGTLGGHAARARLAHQFGRDLPAAILEDLVAIGAAAWIVSAPR